MHRCTPTFVKTGLGTQQLPVLPICMILLGDGWCDVMRPLLFVLSLKETDQILYIQMNPRIMKVRASKEPLKVICLKPLVCH